MGIAAGIPDMYGKNIELLVETHRIARGRIRAGLPSWAHKVDIGGPLARDPDDVTPVHVAAVANEIASLLKAGLPAYMFDVCSDRYERDLADAVELLEDMEAVHFEGDENGSAAGAFNGILSDIYDWADVNRVWLRS